jgi:phage-related minor tail protein
MSKDMVEVPDDLFPYADEAADHLATALQRVRRAKDITRELGTRMLPSQAAELEKLMKEADKAVDDAAVAINTLWGDVQGLGENQGDA